MKISFNVDEKTGQTYIPKALRENGFEGEVEAYAVGDVVVLKSNKALPKQVILALRFLANEIESRVLVS